MVLNSEQGTDPIFCLLQMTFHTKSIFLYFGTWWFQEPADAKCQHGWHDEYFQY